MSAIRDYVFSIAEVEADGDGERMVAILGTGFRVGNQSLALTAAHVVKATYRASKRLAGIFIDSAHFVAVPISAVNFHATEDVALLSLDMPPIESVLAVSIAEEHSSCPCHLWGYASDIQHEFAVDGIMKPRPELVYEQGYVRRRLSLPLPTNQIPGHNFYELSDIGGQGWSGGPIIKSFGSRRWPVYSIFVGEHMTAAGQIATAVSEATYVKRVSYGVRLSALASWSPPLLGTANLAEALG